MLKSFWRPLPLSRPTASDLTAGRMHDRVADGQRRPPASVTARTATSPVSRDTRTHKRDPNAGYSRSQQVPKAT